MARLYGERWKTGDALGQGGQSHVFRAVDTRGQYAGEFALKRVLNPHRHQRFRNEIEAIKKLHHPNVIRLIDHSALDDPSTDEKQFMVMPIAAGGDLSAAGRLSLYPSSPDSVVLVAKQIAGALAAAHAANIIHRDIKPQNILFTGNGHETWLTDFGICLLRENPRSTDEGEVVGPRAFMAPELEDGGKLDVTPAADIYSFGKVMYYMLSGGTVLPRERMHEAQYARVFSQGERFRLLEALLQQMICPLDRRLQKMADVIERLEKIEAWEKNAQLLPIGQQGLADIAKLQRHAVETQRVTAANSDARAQEAATLASVSDGFHSWLRSELEKTAAHISGGGLLKCEARRLTQDANENWVAAGGPSKMYVPVTGWELQLEQATDVFQRRHLLQIRLCQLGGMRIIMTTGGGIQSPREEPIRDLQLAMIPFYRQTRANEHPSRSAMMGFLTARTPLGRATMPPGHIYGPQVRRGRGPVSVALQPVMRTFQPGISQCTEFSASEWPNTSDKLRVALTEAVDSFIAYVANGANSVGP